MRFTIIFACTAGLSSAMYNGDDLWSSDKILYIRDALDHQAQWSPLELDRRGLKKADLDTRFFESSKQSLLQRRDSSFHHLQRREPASSGIKRPGSPQTSRSRSPSPSKQAGTSAQAGPSLQRSGSTSSSSSRGSGSGSSKYHSAWSLSTLSSSPHSSPGTSPNASRGSSPNKSRGSSPGTSRSTSPVPEQLGRAQPGTYPIRTGRSDSSGSSSGDSRNSSPAVSPTNRVRLYAQGPAKLRMMNDGSLTQKTIRRGSSGSLNGEFQRWTNSAAESTGSPSADRPQIISGSVKGQSGLVTNRPSPGGRGNVKVEKHGFAEANYPVVGTVGENNGLYKSAASHRPGGVKLTTSAEHGGEVRVAGMPQNIANYQPS